MLYYNITMTFGWKITMKQFSIILDVVNKGRLI